jgi:hypothetical protein
MEFLESTGCILSLISLLFWYKKKPEVIHNFNDFTVIGRFLCRRKPVSVSFFLFFKGLTRFSRGTKTENPALGDKHRAGELDPREGVLSVKKP